MFYLNTINGLGNALDTRVPGNPNGKLAKFGTTVAIQLQEMMLKSFQVAPTDDQNRAIGRLARFASREADADIFILSGYAGTGKSTLAGVLVKALAGMGMGTILLATTGRAAKILSQHSGRATETIHHHIYEMDSMVDGLPQFRKRRQPLVDTIFIVDEASMISSRQAGTDRHIWGDGGLLDQLLSFVFSGPGNRIIFIGDDGQLPPVGDNVSPALSVDYFISQGYRVERADLLRVVRQDAGGPLEFATSIRDCIASGRFPARLKIPEHDDIQCAIKTDALESLRLDIDSLKAGRGCILAWTNATTNWYNRWLRRELLGLQSELVVGERVIVSANNYQWHDKGKGVNFLANGEQAIVEWVGPVEKIGPGRFREAVVSVETLSGGRIQLFGQILLNLLDGRENRLPPQVRKQIIAEITKARYPHLQGDALRDALRRDPYLNALQVRYGYAMTAHKAQGGQWASVYIDLEDWRRLLYHDPITALRWLYTAVTRTTKHLYLVGLPPGVKALPLGGPFVPTE
jgi:exodeoxyribonuclease-5